MKKMLSAWMLILFSGGLAVFAANETLIPAGAVWRYSDTGADLGIAWRQPDFNDTSWPMGAAQLGYGDGDETTVIRSSPVYSCYYFRHSFSIADPARYQSLNLEILRDDGAVVYLNGAEVARYNMPAGSISYGTWASSALEYAWDPPQSIANLLVAGINVIAVEVHQGNSTSTDVSLDLKLTGVSEISIVLNSPVSGAIGVPLDTPLSATVTDPEGQNMTVTFHGRLSPPAQPDFSLIVLPDIQKYTAEVNGGSKAILASQTDWIRANRDNLNIVYVAQMGDISDNGDNDTDQSEWINAAASLYSLETPLPSFPEGIPYGAAVGNHDQIVPAGDTDPTTFYNQYFGIGHFTGKNYYGGHYGTRNNNYYQLFSASGLDFIVIYLEYDTTPDQAVLDWANTLLQSNPNRRGIVVTHYFLETTGAWGPQGLTIYNALKSNPNLFLMLCGHNHGEAQRTDVYAGNTLYTLLQDYQDAANGGNGFLRIFEFSQLNNQIRVKTYSPWLDQYETDANSEFTLSYTMDSGAAFSTIQQNANVPSASQTAANWNGLVPGAAYEWYVTATDGMDTKVSAVSRFTSTEMGNAPAAPSLLSATAQSDTQIALSWTDNADNETGFEIYQSVDNQSFALAGSVHANVISVLITGLQPSTTYYFQARAINGSGPSEYSNTSADVTLPPPPAPAAPGNLNASPISTTEIQLAWTDNSSDETGFQVERSMDQATWTALPRLEPNITTTVDAGLDSGTVYYYRVSAWNGSSASAPSKKAAAAPFIDSYASSETLVAGTLQGSMSGTFVNDSSYEQITEKLSGGKPNVRYSTLQHQWTFSATPGRNVVFWVQAHKSVSTDNETFVFSCSTDNLNYQDMFAVADTADNNTYQSFALPNTLQGTVYIRVQDTDHKAGNVALDAIFIDHMLIRTDASPILAPPSAPVLQQANAGNGSVTLMWDSSSGATSYNVWRRSDVEAVYLNIASEISTATYTDSALASGTTYNYVITAVNSFGESLSSNELSATPQAPTITDPPTALAAAGARRKITLSWIQSVTPGVTQNVIYRSSNSSGPYTLLKTLAPSGTYTDSVASGATWYYVMTAWANGVESPFSNTASATAK